MASGFQIPHRRWRFGACLLLGMSQTAAAEVVDSSAAVAADGQITQLVQASELLAVENRNAVAGGAADLDQDGDLDVLILHRLAQEPPFALINDGHGQLTDEASVRLPAVTSAQTTAGVLTDLDMDGDLDVYVGGQPRDAVWLNDGRGVFSDASTTWLPREWGGTTDLAAGDVTGDGRPDLLMVRAGTVHLLENVSGTALRDATTDLLPGHLDGVSCVTTVDVDGDGVLDLIAGGTQTITFLRNERPRLRVQWSHPNPDHASVTGLATGDLDGDGGIDVVISRHGRPMVLANSGGGRLTLSERLIDLGGVTNQAVLTDLNADQRLDVMLAITGSNLLILGPGSGRSWRPETAWLPSDNEASRLAFVGEFNGDGLLDLYVANDGQDVLYLQRNSP